MSRGRRVALALAAAGAVAVWALASVRSVPPGTIGVRDGIGGGRPVASAPGRSFVPRLLDRLTLYDGQIRETDLGDDLRWTTPEGSTLPFRASVAWRVDLERAVEVHRAAGGREPFEGAVRPAILGALDEAARGPDAPAVGTRAFHDRVRERLAGRLDEVGLELVALTEIRDLPEGGSPVPAAGRPDRNVLVVGLDGADWDLIDPLLARGAMPHLARLIEGGVRARLRTVVPILSPVVWTSAATGKRPDKHGIYDFLARADDGSTVPVTRTLWRARPIWDVLGDAGVDVAVTAWWATWPATPVRGVMATDRIAYQLFGEVVEDDPDAAIGKTWPPGLFDELRVDLVRPGDVGDDALARYVDLAALGEPVAAERERVEQLRTILASTRTYEAIAARFLERRRSGFHAVYHEATDTVGHLFMPFHGTPVAGSDPVLARAYGGAVEAAYRDADALIGRLLARIDDGWNVVVLSDHGFKHGDNRPATDSRTDRAAAADWHDRFGVLVLHGPDVRTGAVVRDASILDVAPTLLALYGLPIPDDLDGRVLDDAFVPRFVAARPADTVATYELPDRPTPAAVASDRDAAVLERLRSLGYIGGTGESGVPGEDRGGFTQDGARALNHRGVALLARGDRDGALAAFEEALAGGGGVASLVNITRLKLATLDVAGARESLARLERAAPDFAQLPALRGWLADLEGDPVAARRALGRAIEVDPADSRSLSRLGHLEEVAGRLDEAERLYREAVRADPENAEAFNYLGNVLRATGRPAEAEDAYRAAVDADPRSPGGINNLGLMLLRAGRVDAAVALYRTGLEHVPGSALLRNSLAAALLRAGEAAAAEVEARTAIESAPELVEAHNNLGIALAEQGRSAEAVTSFARAVELDPDDFDGWFNLGRARLMQGDREGALEGFARASSLRPDHFEAAVGAAETARALGRVDVARRHYERAAAIRPDSTRVADRLADLRAGTD